MQQFARMLHATSAKHTWHNFYETIRQKLYTCKVVPCMLSFNVHFFLNSSSKTPDTRVCAYLCPAFLLIFLNLQVLLVVSNKCVSLNCSRFFLFFQYSHYYSNRARSGSQYVHLPVSRAYISPLFVVCAFSKHHPWVFFSLLFLCATAAFFWPTVSQPLQWEESQAPAHAVSPPSLPLLDSYGRAVSLPSECSVQKGNMYA